MLMEPAKFLLLKALVHPAWPCKAREQTLTTNLSDHPSRGLSLPGALLCMSRCESRLQMAANNHTQGSGMTKSAMARVKPSLAHPVRT